MEIGLLVLSIIALSVAISFANRHLWDSIFKNQPISKELGFCILWTFMMYVPVLNVLCLVISLVLLGVIDIYEKE